MRYSHSFYLDLLGFLSNKFPNFTWGEDDLGYYWEYYSNEKSINLRGFQNLQDLVDNILEYLEFVQFL